MLARSKLYPHVMTGPELAAKEFKERTWLVDGVLPHPSMGMLYAEDGVGKSWAAMSLALAVASGASWLRPDLEVGRPRGVLHVDGELTEDTLKERFCRLYGRALPENLRVLSLAAVKDGLDLANEEDWREVVMLVQDYHDKGFELELIILDNWSALVFEKDENDNAEVKKIFKWPNWLRGGGVSTLWVHHTGVSGRQRGATARRGPLDYVCTLERPDGHPASGTARFIVDLDKTRHKPVSWSAFEVALEEAADGRLVWTRKARSLGKGAVKVMEVLKAADGPVAERVLRAETKLNGMRMGKALDELVQEGLIKRVSGSRSGWVLTTDTA